MSETKKSQYRLRVYQMPDLTIELVFGDSAAPVDGKLLSDHDVVETVVTTPHVEPA